MPCKSTECFRTAAIREYQSHASAAHSNVLQIPFKKDDACAGGESAGSPAAIRDLARMRANYCLGRVCLSIVGFWCFPRPCVSASSLSRCSTVVSGRVYEAWPPR